jgi:hypothetical protein
MPRPTNKKTTKKHMKNITNLIAISALAATVSFANANVAPNFQDNMNKSGMQQDMMMMQKSSQFKGIEVNKGSVEFYMKEGRAHLKWSNDFQVPNSPAPHWQVVDAQGNVFLLNRLVIAGDKQNRDIVLPKNIKSIAKVQIWCSFAEVNLGEATFAKKVML